MSFVGENSDFFPECIKCRKGQFVSESQIQGSKSPPALQNTNLSPPLDYFSIPTHPLSLQY